MAQMPRESVVDLLEDTGTMSEAGALLSLLEWVEVEARGDLLEGLRRLRGAVMKAAAAGMRVLPRVLLP